MHEHISKHEEHEFSKQRICLLTRGHGWEIFHNTIHWKLDKEGATDHIPAITPKKRGYSSVLTKISFLHLDTALSSSCIGISCKRTNSYTLTFNVSNMK